MLQPATVAVDRGGYLGQSTEIVGERLRSPLEPEQIPRNFSGSVPLNFWPYYREGVELHQEVPFQVPSGDGAFPPHPFIRGFNSTPHQFGPGILRLKFNSTPPNSPPKCEVELLDGLVGGFNKKGGIITIKFNPDLRKIESITQGTSLVTEDTRGIFKKLLGAIFRSLD